MRGRMARESEPNGSDPKAKVPAQRSSRHLWTDGARRWNSIGALSCRREACCTAASRHLCHLCRLSVCESSRLPVLDLLLNTGPAGRWSHTSLTSSHPVESHPSLLDLPTKSVPVVGVNRWDFDIFSLRRRSSSNLICCLGMRMLEIHNLFDLLHLDRLTVTRTLTAVESVYWQHNPYHTALHAADVTQAIHCFISLPKLRELLTPAEILGSVLAAFCHDADHPGTNQLYLERTGHPLVKLYNNNSVLEQHHARVGLSILHQSGLAASLTANDWATVRECIVKMVHATDMAHQTYYRTKFMKLVNAKRDHPASAYTEADRILLLQMSLKCADVSNPCRPWEACREWAYRICEEFFCQGDRERLQWSLTPSKAFDRTGASVPAIQLAFIDSCIRPLFTSWHEFFRSKFTLRLLSSLNANYDRWQRLAADEQLQHATRRVEQRNPGLTSRLYAQSEPKSSKRRFLFGWTPNAKKLFHPSTHRTTVPLRLSQCEQLTSHIALTKQDAIGPSTEPRGLQTFFITTTSLRRHSLPETQGAIKKTFTFARSRRSNASNYPVDPRTTVCATGPTVHCVYLTSSTFRSLRSGPGTILQTLCEEIINQEPSPRKLHRAFEQDPFPLPDAWNPSSTGPVASGPRTSSYMTKLAIDFSASDFLALAQRRSSVPLVDR